MPRYRQIYNIFGVFAGSAPATGFHYLDYNGIPANNPNLTIFDTNLLKQIDRVNSLGYSIGFDETNITQLGERGLVDRIIVNRPTVNLDFAYYVAGVRNENNLGFIVNYPDITGRPIYSTEESCIKNFTGYETDSRNIFVAVAPDFEDLSNRIKDPFSIFQGRSDTLHPRDLMVYGFGNCYLNSYKLSAAIGEIPYVNIGYVCDNLMYYNSGSGARIPAIESRSGTLIKDAVFTIPRMESVPSPSVIRPKDITVDIGKYAYPSITGMGAGSVSFVEGVGNYFSDNRYWHAYRVYPYKIINGTQYFGTGYTQAQSRVDDNFVSYHASVTWPRNYSADGYRVFFYRSTSTPFNFFLANRYYCDTYATSILDGSGIEIGLLGPTSAPTPMFTSPIFVPLSGATLGTSSINIPMQNFELSMGLDREDLKSIGHVSTIDRRLNFPVFVDFDFSSIVGEGMSGSLVDRIKDNTSYDFIINMYNPNCGETGRQLALKYNLYNAKLVEASNAISLSSKLISNFKFRAETDIGKIGKMFVMSGLLNSPFPAFPYNYLMLQNLNSGFLFTQDGNLLITSQNIPTIV